MLRHPGNLIGDSWFHVHENMVHCFYLTCSENLERHKHWDIGHATSTDLTNWQIHDTALEAAARGSWDDGLATGSILKWQGRFWMAYSSSRTAQVGLAVSDNLETWEKLPENPVTEIDTRYYESIGSGIRHMAHWRDPFLFEHDGFVYHAVCASRNDGAPDSRGTLGLAHTRNMVEWEVRAPPDIERVVQELECPAIHAANGLYFLLFSTVSQRFSQNFIFRHRKNIIDFASYSMVGPSPLGPFRMFGNGSILPLDFPHQPYACQVVVLNEQPWLLGTEQLSDGGVVSNPIPIQFTPKGMKLSDSERN